MTEPDTLITIHVTPAEIAHLRAGLVCWEGAHHNPNPEQNRLHLATWRLLTDAHTRAHQETQ